LSLHQDGRVENPSDPNSASSVAKKASIAVCIGAALPLVVVKDPLAGFIAGLEEPVMDEELALIVVGPFEPDGQKLPVCCKQLNC
jgi:hypothetical protein